MNWYQKTIFYKTAQEKIQFSNLAIGDTFYHTYYGIAEKTGEDTYKTETKPVLTIRDKEDYVGQYTENYEGDEMDIGSGSGYPASALSNFSPHPFTIDGVSCASMEGLLQSLKYSNPEMQKHVCTLVGKAAKFKGKKKKWWRDQKLYWQGMEMDRDGAEYQSLLDRAFEAMFNDSDSFRRALKASGNATLTHSMGKNDTSSTVLTTREFVRRLTALRNRL